MPLNDVTPLNPAYFLDRAAKIFSERTAVIDGERRFTYCEFGERSHRLGWAATERGRCSKAIASLRFAAIAT